MAAKESRSEGPLTASVERLRQELDKWLDVAMTQGGKALNAMGLRSAGKSFSPAIDCVETADDVLVFVSLPGTDPKTVDVTIAGNMLTVKGETPAISAGEDDVIQVHQLQRGPFQRSIPLPSPVEPDSVSASSCNGILQIRLAKSERSKSRQIPVSVDAGEAMQPTA